MLTTHDGAKVGEIDVDNSRAAQQPPDAPETLRQQIVGDFEGLDQAGVVVDQLEHALIRQAQHRVGRFLELFQALLRLTLAPRAFALKGQRRHGQHQRSRLPGHARQHGTGARARAAAQTGHNHDHPGARAELAQPFSLLFRRGPPDFRIAAGSQAASQQRPQRHHALD